MKAQICWVKLGKLKNISPIYFGLTQVGSILKQERWANIKT